MCDPTWGFWDCFFAIYLVQFILFVVGGLLVIIYLISTNAPVQVEASEDHPKNAYARKHSRSQLPKTSEAKPIVKFKELEINPFQLSPNVRVGLISFGLVFIVVGVVWAVLSELQTPLVSRRMPTPTVLPTSTVLPTAAPATATIVPPVMQNVPPVFLENVTFMNGGWNPRRVDLATAASQGIPVDYSGSLKLYDLRLRTPDDVPYGYEAQVEATANDVGEPIGKTKRAKLTPGTVKLGDLIASSFQFPNKLEAWAPQRNWSELTLTLNLYKTGIATAIQQTKTHIRLSGTGFAWFHQAPYASIVTVVYQINNGEKMVLDPRTAVSIGIPAKPGDKLTIHEIWFKSRYNDPSSSVHAEAFIWKNNNDEDSDYLISKKPMPFKLGVSNLLVGEVFQPEKIEADDTKLILTLVRIDEAGNEWVLDRYDISLMDRSPMGLVPATPVSWPEGDLLYLDFEKTEDLAGWLQTPPTLLGRSQGTAISGNYTLSVTVQTTEANTNQVMVTRDKPFQAKMIIGQVYWPEKPGVHIDWSPQFCLAPGKGCVTIPDHLGHWNTFFIDLTSMIDEDGNTLDQVKIPNFYFQGSFSSSTPGEPYTFYVDGIQIYPTTK